MIGCFFLLLLLLLNEVGGEDCAARGEAVMDLVMLNKV